MDSTFDEDNKSSQESNNFDLLVKRFRNVTLKSPEDNDKLVFSEYDIGREGFIRTHVLIHAVVGGEIIGQYGEVAKRITDSYRVRMHSQNVLNFTIVTFSAKRKEDLVKAQLKMWDILASSPSTHIEREIRETLLWSVLTDEEKSDFHANYNIAVTEDDSSLKLSTFNEKLYDAGYQFLTSGEDCYTEKDITYLVKDSPLKSIILVNGRHLAGYIYGKQGKGVKRMREHYNTENTTLEYDDTTAVILSSESEAKLVEASFDIWRSVSKIMKVNKFICRRSLANFWNNHLTLAEKVQFMNITKVFLAHIPDMDSLLIRSFSYDAAEAAKKRLVNLLECGSDKEDDV